MLYKEQRIKWKKFSKKRNDPWIIERLEHVFECDGTVEEACSYAGISTSTYYEWCSADPMFELRMDAAKKKMFLEAREGLRDNIKAKDIRAIDIFLKKRDPRYKDKAEVDVSATVEWIEIEVGEWE